MANRITIRPAGGTWVIRAGGAILGESANALEVTEGGHAPVIYFPRGDVALAFLDQSDATSRCPFKGDAQYFHIVAKSGRIENAAWSYESPLAAMEQIKDHLAFYSDRVAVEQL